MSHVPSNTKIDKKNHDKYKGNKEKFLKDREKPDEGKGK